MTWSRRHYGIFLLVCVLAVILRIYRLGERPFHVDEAVNGLILERLLTEGTYAYDPAAFHGPALYYFSGLFLHTVGLDNAAALTETSLRIVPAAIGSLLILLLLPLRRILPPRMIIFCGLLFAVSPILVYYSRYFIHEMLMVVFTFGFFVHGFKFIQTKRISTAVWSGLFAGLMISTKETWIIFLPAGLLVLAAPYIRKRPEISVKPWHFLCIAGALMLPVLIFYTSVFTDISRLTDVAAFPEHYVQRAGGAEIHRHPFSYYFSTLFFSSGTRFYFPAETGLLILLFAGLWRHRRQEWQSLTVLSGLYSVILFLGFSLIPYKTPWNIAGVMPFFILCTGLLLSGNDKPLLSRPEKSVAALAVVLLSVQVLLVNFVRPADPANPYTYAQSGDDVNRIRSKMRQLDELLPAGGQLQIVVIAREHAYWPLPWILRGWQNTGWWDHIPDNFYRADLLFISASLEPEVGKRLYEQVPLAERSMYVHLFDRPMELYPGNGMVGLIKHAVWEEMVDKDVAR